MRRHNILEVFYVMYSPLIMLLGNVICGLFYLCEVYSIAYYFSVLTGYSLIFIPQFIINCKRYKLCKYYKAATISLFISIVLSLTYQIRLLESTYWYVRLILIINIIGCICYLFVKNCTRHTNG